MDFRMNQNDNVLIIRRCLTCLMHGCVSDAYCILLLMMSFRRLGLFKLSRATCKLFINERRNARRWRARARLQLNSRFQITMFVFRETLSPPQRTYSNFG